MRNIGRFVHITDDLETYLKFKGLLGDFIQLIKHVSIHDPHLTEPLLDLSILNSATSMAQAMPAVGVTNKFGSLSAVDRHALSSECHYILQGLATGQGPILGPLSKYIGRFNLSKAGYNTNTSRAHQYHVRALVHQAHNGMGLGAWHVGHGLEALKTKKQNPNKFKEVI